MDDKLLKLLGRAQYAPANVPELLRLLHLRPNQQQELQRVLQRLQTQGSILRTKGNRYILARVADLVPGVISITKGGRGFLQPDDATLEEIAIPAEATATALHGDRVMVRRDVQPKGLLREAPETTGSVVRILERKRSQFVGTLRQGRQFLYVVPDDPRFTNPIFVPPPQDVGRRANIGDKVVVEIQHWESRETNPEGEVIEVLGAPDDEGVDMLSVIRHYELPLHFPRNVLNEARAIASARSLSDASPDDLQGRVDCREHDVITIDPDDAKDFDDAICLRRRGADRYQLWVHIADVSHYVKPGNALDAEARKRGNSTYLVDRVIPMLPEALSNELCSLKPGVDRLTKCVEFTLSGAGAVLETRFYSAVIRSKRRFTYQEVLALLNRPASHEPIERMVHEAHQMAQRIRRTRFKEGSLDLDFPENKIRLDERGRVTVIERIENDVSHQLIEEYMLLANEAVAARLMNLRRPAVYRVHEAPKAKRLLQYRDDVLAHGVPCGNLSIRAEVQKLLQRCGNLAIGPALKIGLLRSLMRARYAVEPLGHYGLAKEKYTHFTSPIRRYADLVVHRVLFEHEAITSAVLKDIADHLSNTERNSADAERDSKEVKLYAHLEEQIRSGKPQPYPAMVTDVRNFGFFVEVPSLGLSGLVHLSFFQDDFFTFDPTRNRLTSRVTRREIQVGDNLTVQIARVNREKKMVDFRVAEATESRHNARPKRVHAATASVHSGRGRRPSDKRERTSQSSSPKRAPRSKRHS